MAAAFEYGNLLTAQQRGNYRMPSQGAEAANAVLGNTQNWAQFAAASSASQAERKNAFVRAASETASQGISSYGSLANAVVNAYGGIAQQGIQSSGRLAEAETAIEVEKIRRGGTMENVVRPLLGAAVGIAAPFIAESAIKDDGVPRPPDLSELYRALGYTPSNAS